MLRFILNKRTFTVAGSGIILSIGDEEKKKSWLETKLESLYGNGLVPNVSLEKTDPSTFTCWERLYVMHTKNEFGNLSRELHSVLYTMYTSFVIGGLIGTVTRTKEAFTTFMERNQGTQFANIHDARKQLQDAVLRAGFKGLWTYGTRLSFFAGGVIWCTISLMVLFDSSSVLFYGLSAGTIGAIHRWKFGPKGMLVGGAVGSILGLTAGGVTNGILMLTGKTMEDVMTYQSEMIISREKIAAEVIKKASTVEVQLDPMLKDHEDLVNAGNKEDTIQELKKEVDTKKVETPTK